MRADYFADLVSDVPGVPGLSPVDRGCCKPHEYADVPGVPSVPGKKEQDVTVGEVERAETDSSAIARQRIAELPLAAKLRIYGRPWPLKIDGRVVCWLVADDAAAKGCNKPEPVYAAAEVEHMAALPPTDVQQIHKLKARFDVTVSKPDDEVTP